jgi:hypothetical protein
VIGSECDFTVRVSCETNQLPLNAARRELWAMTKYSTRQTQVGITIVVVWELEHQDSDEYRVAAQYSFDDKTGDCLSPIGLNLRRFERAKEWFIGL